MDYSDAADWVLYDPQCFGSRRRRYTAAPTGLPAKEAEEPASTSEAQQWAEFCHQPQSQPKPARVLVSGWPVRVRAENSLRQFGPLKASKQSTGPKSARPPSAGKGEGLC